MGNRFLKIIIGITIAIIALIYLYFILPFGRDFTVTILPGERASKVFNQIESQNVIYFKFIGRRVFYRPSIALKLKPGFYKFKSTDTMYSLIHDLTEGNSQRFLFRIGEGSTASQMKLQLKEHPLLNLNHVFSTSDEGIYFPDTYFYDVNSSLNDILESASTKMNKVLDSYWDSRLIGLPVKNKYQLLIVASLIEKETPYNDEKPAIARIIYNRLEQRMELQFCSSIIYLIGEPRKLTYNDLKIKSPYNTYIHRGLPPTPIAYPSESSIAAAALPVDHDYLFFILDDNGRHTFTKTFKQHQLEKYHSN